MASIEKSGKSAKLAKTNLAKARKSVYLARKSLVQKFNPYHDDLGRFATGGGVHLAPDTGGTTGGGHSSHNLVDVDRDDQGNILRHGKIDADMTARAKHLRIPPKWTGVRMSSSARSDLQVTGKDTKGRTQYLYSAAHNNRAAAEKFARVKQMVKQLPKIDHALSRDAKTNDEAAVLLVMRKTGMRIGSTADTKADKQAYGASTLMSDHVKVAGSKVTFDFVGKKGVHIQQEVHDVEMASVLHSRLTGHKGPIFNTDDAKVRNYLNGIAPGFKPKDFRTVKAAEVALKAIHDMPAPTSKKAFEKAKNAVADEVAKQLGNTRDVAKSSYIPPEVFGPWQSGIAM